MKKYFLILLFALAVMIQPILSWGQQALCTGAFPNPVTDICWDCMFPISLGGGILNLGITGTDYNTGVTPMPQCICINTLAVGTPMSMWEPRYMLDVTNIPGCYPLMSGLTVSPPMNASEYGTTQINDAAIGGTSKSAFMHVNEYINPILTTLGIIAASPCLDNRSFDTPYMSWADPTWNDDSLSLTLTPYAYAFTGLASIAAEGPDAIQATASFPNQYLFWVAGAWGPMYPLTGNVATANTPEQVSHLLLARLFAKLHAAGVEQSVAGQTALDACSAFGFPELIMDKRQYKTQRTFPFSDNMCTPIGRPLQFQEIGAARPIDKDYGYFIFQRKDCCQPLSTQAP
jgi:conjugal transfer pilus assembly protein TraU